MSACKTCGKQLSAVNRTGWCRLHYGAANNGPRTAEQNRRQWSDPALRERVLAPLRRYNRTRLDWCPFEYQDYYRELTRVKHLLAAEARCVVEGLIAADTARYARTGELQQSRRRM
ncbi:hypothetical protein [Sphingomonas soli]|uniref:hypothetical protein n=1 Tax=Sphingomonas soli TaxID=266127 RepID=UPI000A76269A|nr:hypothetical protein [Sphingomonas soli]